MARLSDSEERLLKEYLWSRLCFISRNYPMLVPSPSSSAEDLMEKYFTWAKRFNCGRIPEQTEYGPIAEYLAEEFDKF